MVCSSYGAGSLRFFAVFRATTFHFLPAGRALNKEQVTAVIGAIGMVVARHAALMALRNNILGNPLTKTGIKHKVLTFKQNRKPLFPCLAGIFNDAALQVKNVFEPLLLKVGTCFFAANATSAIHNYGLVTHFRKHVYRHG